MADLSLVFKATVVLVVALLAARVAGRAAASVRALVLASAFAALLVLPLAIVAIPPRTVEIPAASMHGLLVPEDVFEASLATAAPRSTNVASLPTSSFRMPSLAMVSRSAWGVGALLFVAPIAIALWRLRRMRTSGLPWLEGRALAAEVAVHSGVARPVDVFLHEALAAPMTCGVYRPAIGLPIDAPLWAAADLRHALVHEMEHVRRRDWPVHLMARLVCALYWFHPLAWIAWGQLSLESERACDDAVVRGAEGTAYAEQLVSLARRLSKHSPVPMLSMADRSNLSTRVTAVLDSRLARGRAGLISASVIVFAAIGLTATLSPLQAVSGPAAEAGDQAAQAPAVMRFEVASVKRNTSGDPSRARLEPGGRFTAISVPLLQLITQAYGLGVPVVNAPDWVAAERYDVIAKAPEGVSFTPQTPMPAFLRGLLTERFAFQAHLEPREMPIYELVLARSDRTLGPKISQAAADCSVPRDAGPPVAPGSPGAECALLGRVTAGNGRAYRMAGFPMSNFAEMLGGAVERKVVDRTGLPGAWTLDLEFTPDAQADSPGNSPSIFTAVQEQLGLRLQPARGPVDVLVIDRVERPAPDDVPAAAAPQSPAPLAFDVASVRRNTSGEQIMRGPLVQPGNRVVAQNIAVRFLITTAYSLEFNQIVGAPPWIDTDRFDIEARAKPDAAPDDLKAMLRALLAERFRLTAHFESQERPIYTLVRTRAGSTPGLRTSGEGCAPMSPPTGGTLPPPPPPPPPPQPGQAAPRDVPLTATAEVTGCPRMFFPGFIGARRISLRDFANSLTNFARRRVVDGTGLTGPYDIDLRFAVEGLPPGAPQPPADDNVPTLLTAVEEQLGLRLEPGRASVQVLVIDRVEPPTAN